MIVRLSKKMLGSAGVIEELQTFDCVGIKSFQLTIPKAKDGELTTRTNDTVGTLTMGAGGHGITTGSKFDIYWDGGYRAQVTAGTVSGTSVPFSSGSGDNLPALNSDITAGPSTVIDLFGVPDNVQDAIPEGGDGTGLMIFGFQLSFTGSADTSRGIVCLDYTNIDDSGNLWVNPVDNKELIAWDMARIDEEHPSGSPDEWKSFDYLHVSNGSSLLDATFTAVFGYGSGLTS